MKQSTSPQIIHIQHLSLDHISSDMRIEDMVPNTQKLRWHVSGRYDSHPNIRAGQPMLQRIHQLIYTGIRESWSSMGRCWHHSHFTGTPYRLNWWTNGSLSMHLDIKDRKFERQRISSSNRGQTMVRRAFVTSVAFREESRILKMCNWHTQVYSNCVKYRRAVWVGSRFYTNDQWYVKLTWAEDLWLLHLSGWVEALHWQRTILSCCGFTYSSSTRFGSLSQLGCYGKDMLTSRLLSLTDPTHKSRRRERNMPNPITHRAWWLSLFGSLIIECVSGHTKLSSGSSIEVIPTVTNPTLSYNFKPAGLANNQQGILWRSASSVTTFSNFAPTPWPWYFGFTIILRTKLCLSLLILWI